MAQTAAFTFAFVNNQPDLVQFTGQQNQCVEYETWSLGDGTMLTDVSDPLHLYLPPTNPTTTNFVVTHTVQINGVTHSSTSIVTVVFATPPTGPCSDRYFQYDVSGCYMTISATVLGSPIAAGNTFMLSIYAKY
jgi:hypothetical protein